MRFWKPFLLRMGFVLAAFVILYAVVSAGLGR